MGIVRHAEVQRVVCIQMQDVRALIAIVSRIAPLREDRAAVVYRRINPGIDGETAAWIQARRIWDADVLRAAVEIKSLPDFAGRKRYAALEAAIVRPGKVSCIAFTLP